MADHINAAGKKSSRLEKLLFSRHRLRAFLANNIPSILHWVEVWFRKHVPAVLGIFLVVLGFIAAVCPNEPATVRIQRFVEGVDVSPKAMTDEEVKDELNDPWAFNILRKGLFPSDLDKTLSGLTAAGMFPERDSYFVSESGSIPVSAATASLQREFRMVITREGPKDNLPVILISAPAGDRSGFIELLVGKRIDLRHRDGEMRVVLGGQPDAVCFSGGAEVR